MPAATATDVVEGDTCNVTVTGEQTDAGSHTATAKALSNANYALPEANTQAFTIEARPVIVKARSASKVYGKKDPKLTAKVSGLADGESAELIRYALTREAGEDAGEYAITAGGDAVQGNYIVTYQGAALTIREKTVRSPKVKVRVTGLTYDGRAKQPAVTVTAGKTVIPAGEYKVVYSDNVLPGEATVTVSDVPGGNYAVGEASTTFPIAKSVFALTAKAEGKNALAYVWDKASGAQGYDLYFSRCGSNGKKELYKTVKASKQSLTVTGLKSGVSYKAKVKAWRKVNGKKVYLAASPMVHTYTGGRSKHHTNGKSLKVNVKRLTLKVGKTGKIVAKVRKLYPKLTLNAHVKSLRYFSTDKSVARVNGTGTITAKGKGTCRIIVVTPDGISRKIRVTVRE